MREVIELATTVRWTPTHILAGPGSFGHAPAVSRPLYEAYSQNVGRSLWVVNYFFCAQSTKGIRGGQLGNPDKIGFGEETGSPSSTVDILFKFGLHGSTLLRELDEKTLEDSSWKFVERDAQTCHFCGHGIRGNPSQTGLNQSLSPVAQSFVGCTRIIQKTSFLVRGMCALSLTSYHVLRRMYTLTDNALSSTTLHAIHTQHKNHSCTRKYFSKILVQSIPSSNPRSTSS